MCYVLNGRNKRNLYTLYIRRILRIRRILQEYGYVFKDPQSLPRQFLPYSNSQNIIGVNLLGNYSTSYYYFIDFNLLYLHTQPINEPIVVLTIRFRYIQPVYTRRIFIIIVVILELLYNIIAYILYNLYISAVYTNIILGKFKRLNFIIVYSLLTLTINNLLIVDFNNLQVASVNNPSAYIYTYKKYMLIEVYRPDP